MIITKENENAFVFKTRIEFEGEGGATEFVELREFNTAESHIMLTSGGISQNGDVENVVAMLEKAEKFFPDCVVDSSFQYEDGTKLTGRQVYDILKKSNQLFSEITSVWLNSDRKGRLIKKAEGGNPLV